MGMKYVMFRTQTNPARDWPVIFPDTMVHLDVANAVVRAWEIGQREAMRDGILGKKPMVRILPVSAGSVRLGGEAIVSGESETLNMHAMPEDATTINLFEYFHGIKP